MKDRVYFYGCWGPTRYALWTRERKIVFYRDVGVTDRMASRLDGGYAPGSLFLGGKLKLADFDDQIEGVVRDYFEDGWTVLSFWDRSNDPNFNAHSTYLVKGTFTIGNALRLARAYFPDKFNNYPFHLFPLAGSFDESG